MVCHRFKLIGHICTNLCVAQLKHVFYSPGSSHHVSNMTFILPPSPILTQEEDISYEIKCGGGSLPPKCRPDMPCQCLHIINVALSSTMELTLINQGNQSVNNLFKKINTFSFKPFFVWNMIFHSQQSILINLLM